MSESKKEDLIEALGQFKDPMLGVSLDEAKTIKALHFTDGRAVLEIELGFPAKKYAAELKASLTRLLGRMPGVESVEVSVTSKIVSHAVQGNLKPVGKIKNIIAVASGKGGVGKSTTAVNVALALAAEGASVGILDADIYGPSQPRMLGLSGQRPETVDNSSMKPLRGHGIECMSIGFLIDEEQPMVWRGPMVTQALSQLISDTRWGELDYLIVDMPPGTGDIQLTLSQRVPVSGAIIVTTPQDIALLDARKGLNMFRKVNVNVLGIVENMSTHICSQCGHVEAIFGSGGGSRMAEQFDVPLLGRLPLDISIREETDAGKPSVIAAPESEIATGYRNVALRASAVLSLAARSYAGRFPNIVVENT
ncbi:MAG: iron-sulfur cluster carrier protein ApbC [Gammaproteobacteria bacterium]|nr:iron-sulfur cluster carrier protein ApbC [Gammaproteobacteria bacterium]